MLQERLEGVIQILEASGEAESLDVSKAHPTKEEGECRAAQIAAR